MIPRRLRLSRQDFESVLGGSGLQRAQSPHFSIVYGPKPEGSGGCGVVVSKKVVKSSVARHLLKRRIREVIRPTCRIDAVLVVYARPGAPSLPFEELKSELSELLERSGV